MAGALGVAGFIIFLFGVVAVVALVALAVVGVQSSRRRRRDWAPSPDDATRRSAGVHGDPTFAGSAPTGDVIPAPGSERRVSDGMGNAGTGAQGGFGTPGA